MVKINKKRMFNEYNSLINFNPEYILINSLLNDDTDNKTLISSKVFKMDGFDNLVYLNPYMTNNKISFNQGFIDVNEVILNNKFYKFKIKPQMYYPLSNINISISIPHEIEMYSRFGKYFLNKTKLSNDCIDKILDIVVNNIDISNITFKPFIDSKTYLLNYGISTQSLFEYDEKLIASPLKMMGDYFNDFLNLCEKYSYTSRYINKWDSNKYD